jgi:cytochrome c oxidase subunit 4
MAHGSHPNYNAIFWWLLVLTIVEVGVGVMKTAPGAAHVGKVVSLVVLALAKAVLVAMYFMHLRFERRTLALIAGTPLVLCVLLMLLLLPDAAGSRAGNPLAAAPAHGAAAEAAPAPAEPAPHGEAAPVTP